MEEPRRGRGRPPIPRPPPTEEEAAEAAARALLPQRGRGRPRKRLPDEEAEEAQAAMAEMSRAKQWPTHRARMLREIADMADRLADCGENELSPRAVYLDGPPNLACLATLIAQRAVYMDAVEKSADKDEFPRREPVDVSTIGDPIPTKGMKYLVCDCRTALRSVALGLLDAYRAGEDAPQGAYRKLLTAAIRLQVIAMMRSTGVRARMSTDPTPPRNLPFLSNSGSVALVALTEENRAEAEALDIDDEQRQFINLIAVDEKTKVTRRWMLDSVKDVLWPVLIAAHVPSAVRGVYELRLIGMASVSEVRRLFHADLKEKADAITGQLMTYGFHVMTHSHVEGIFLDRRYQGSGLGNEAFTTLADYMIEHARHEPDILMKIHELTLEVHPDNARAIALYARNKFYVHTPKPAAPLTRKEFYPNVRWLVMRRQNLHEAPEPGEDTAAKWRRVRLAHRQPFPLPLPPPPPAEPEPEPEEPKTCVGCGQPLLDKVGAGIATRGPVRLGICGADDCIETLNLI
jgi:RimJ/RimL family protein N-acetyltransferase